MPTIRQVAKACGVSPMTVSFVLNNKRGQVGEETRARVLRVMREMGYRPTVARRPAGVPPISTIGVVAGVPADSLSRPGYWNNILNSILPPVDQHGHNLMLFTNCLLTDIHQSLRVYCDGRCDGLLVISPGIESPLTAALLDRGTPFVTIGDSGEDGRISHVDVENGRAAQEATEHLLALGHRRIGFIGGPTFVRSVFQRQAGFAQAMAQAGLATRPAWEVVGPHRDSDIREAVRVMMDQPARERPSALFVWNDGYALTVLRTLRDMEIRVPRDVSVIGFDDDVIAPLADPPLTTLRQPYAEIGRRAVDILLAHIQDPQAPPQQERLSAALVNRASTAPCAG